MSEPDLTGSPRQWAYKSQGYSTAGTVEEIIPQE